MKPTVANSQPAKIALLDLAVLCVAGIALRLLLSASLRLHAANPSALLPLAASVLGAVVAAFVILAVFVRIWRRRQDWTFYLAAAFLFLFLYKFGGNRPELSSLELPLAIFALLPAGLLVWALLKKIRQADELERRILSEALVFAFVVEFSVAIVYAFLEGLGLRRPPSILWASLLVISWSVGLAISARRYE
jgi:hypothetical protein